jgi:hypothetical protein
MLSEDEKGPEGTSFIFGDAFTAQADRSLAKSGVALDRMGR